MAARSPAHANTRVQRSIAGAFTMPNGASPELRVRVANHANDTTPFALTANRPHIFAAVDHVVAAEYAERKVLPRRALTQQRGMHGHEAPRERVGVARTARALYGIACTRSCQSRGLSSAGQAMRASKE